MKSEIPWHTVRARLGTVPDKVIAVELGVTRKVVWKYRRKRGIPHQRTRATAAREKARKDALASLPRMLKKNLGKATDVALAEEYEVPVMLVRAARLDAGIGRWKAPCGTKAKYRAGCRCRECSHANTAAYLSWRRQSLKRATNSNGTESASMLSTKSA